MRPRPTNPTFMVLRLTLAAADDLLRGGEVPVTLHRRAHQETVAFLDDALAVAGLDVRVSDHDIVLLAGVDHALHPFQQLGMIVLPRNAEFLAEIAFANQDAANARNLGQHRVEVFDAARVLDLQYAENLALRVERPDIGLLEIGRAS